MLTPDEALPLFMERLEALLALFDEHRMVYWCDWGTLLGYHRHRSVIPWDYDADLCLLEEDYRKLLELFAAQGNRIGELWMAPDWYGEASSCACIPFPEDPDGYGFDLMAYRWEGGRIRHLMKPELVAEFPADYDFDEADLFPLERGHFLGRRTLVPRNGFKRLEYYGDWRTPPEEHRSSPLMPPPFRELGAEGPEHLPRVVSATGARTFEGVSELAAGGVFCKGGESIETLWIIAPEELRALEAKGIARAQLEGLSFTRLVFLAERLLWGRLYLHTVKPGDCFALPPGCWAHAVTEHPTRVEG